MTTPLPRCFALVPCAGSGTRSGAAGPKQYVEIGGRSLIAHTLAALAGVERITATLVVLAPDDAGFEPATPLRDAERVWVARCGGSQRAETVARGLAELQRRGVADDDWVLVHDAARCLVQPAWIDRLIDACMGDEVGGLLALPVADTLKRAVDGRAAETVNRADKWAAQTPQMFRLGLLQRALARAGAAVTDEASAIESFGPAPGLVHGDSANLKLTWPADFVIAQALLGSVRKDMP